MQHRVSFVLLTGLLTAGTASAGPLNLNPDNYPAPTGAYAAPPPSSIPIRPTPVQNRGGGFIEMLFGGPSQDYARQPSYNQAPQPYPDQRAPLYGQPQYGQPLYGQAQEDNSQLGPNPNAQIDP